MFRKTIVALLSFLLLTACNSESIEETPNESAETSEEETVVDPERTENSETEAEDSEPGVNTDEAENTTPDNSSESAEKSHVYNNLVGETTFTNAHGYQSWDDYKALIDGFTPGEITIMNQETPDYTAIEGTTQDEIEKRLDSISVREDVYLDENQLSDFEEMHHYRYPPAPDGDYTDVADFLSELSVYYVNDTMMFSAITPGYYEVELNNLPDVETLMSFVEVAEIEEIDPRVYTVAQMTINGENIQQVMIPANGIDQEGNEQVMAFYFFTHGDDILQYAYLPFQMVAQDFPTNSVILYQQIIPELEEL